MNSSKSNLIVFAFFWLEFTVLIFKILGAVESFFPPVGGTIFAQLVIKKSKNIFFKRFTIIEKSKNILFKKETYYVILLLLTYKIVIKIIK